MTPIRDGQSFEDQLLKIGTGVHYVAADLPDGCRAAIVTEIRSAGGYDQLLGLVSLVVFEPHGVAHIQDAPYSADRQVGTWHWHERG